MASRGKNPFEDDDVGGFGAPAKSSMNNSRSGGFGSNSGYGSRDNGRLNNNSNGGIDSGYSVQSQVQQSRERTVDSQQRALQSIYRTEQIGVETASELMEQGEKLRNTETKLDEIDQIQKQSQLHINSLSSVFGGIKNWFAKKPEPVKQSQNIPAMPQSERNPSLYNAMDKVHQCSNPIPQYSQQMEDTKQPEREFDRNLDLMSDGMSRLKGLASGLNSEIDTQNAQLDRMAPKMDRVTNKTREQNKQMNTILYGRPKK